MRVVYCTGLKKEENMAGVEGEDSAVEEVVVVENNTCLHHNEDTSDQTSSPKGKQLNVIRRLFEEISC